jgi:hypothetical protein
MSETTQKQYAHVHVQADASAPETDNSFEQAQYLKTFEMYNPMICGEIALITQV